MAGRKRTPSTGRHTGRRLTMSKGCGCQSGISRWFKPPYAKLFYAACCIHDDDYDCGGSESDRKAADVHLFRNCLHRILLCQFSPSKTAHLVIIALAYYAAVKLMGSHYLSIDIKTESAQSFIELRTCL